MLPWNFTNGGHLGIRNLVGGACDTSNNTVGFVIRTAGLVENNDPIAPGSPASTVRPSVSERDGECILAAH